MAEFRADDDAVADIAESIAILAFARSPPNALASSAASALPVLLVTMGGSDPLGLTLRSARALARCEPFFRARFVIGPGMKDKGAVAQHIVKLAPNFETLEGADDLAPFDPETFVDALIGDPAEAAA